jgi:uncharacterized membrane protein YeaQ/YmgE (transglycosylase-associated protein family)
MPVGLAQEVTGERGEWAEVHMGPISWIIFGALAGWVASLLAGTNKRQGCLGNIAVGIVGALLGGFLVRIVSGRRVVFDWDLRSFIVAVMGAVILLAVTGISRQRA